MQKTQPALPRSVRRTLDRVMLTTAGPRWHRIEAAVDSILDRLPSDATEAQVVLTAQRLRDYCHGA